jgi:hypothetical protein
MGPSARAVVGAGLQVLDDLVLAPRAEARALVAVEAHGVPTFPLAALEPVLLLHGAQDVLGAVACRAVPGPLDEIRPPVPLLRFLRVRLEGPGLEEQRVPTGHRLAHAERPRELRLLRLLAHRPEGIEVGLDGEHVVARHLREPRIGKRRVEVLALVVDPLVHRAVELLVGPVADAGLAVGRDVRRVDDPERRGDRAVAGEGLAPVVGVAGGAIAGVDEVAAALDLAVVGVDREREGRRGERRRGGGEKELAGGHVVLLHALMSGPGLRRYCSLIARAAQKVSAPTVPVGL